jgi:hypothetical protein
MSRVVSMFSVRAVQLGALAFVATTTLAAMSFSRAVHIDPAKVQASKDSLFDAISATTERALSADIRAAVAVDPFSETRSAPAVRYLLPGESDAPSVKAPKQLPKLVWTVISDSANSRAAFQLTNETPKMIRIGEKFGEYTLATLDDKRAILVSAAGERIEVRTPKP